MIIGAVMFWGQLYANKTCDSNISRYMFARLIIGLIGALCTLCGDNNGSEINSLSYYQIS
jgi:hypothetical protein